MNAFMHQIFGFVCAQNPAHTWAPGSEWLPFCQRCTGLYVGALFALSLLIWFRPSTDARYRWLHVILLLLMTPFGFHLVSHGAVLRTMSGYWFGFGVVGLLWLLPVTRICTKAGSIAPSLKHYLIMGVAGIILLPLIAIYGGVFSARILSWLAFVGLVATACLLVVNIIIFGSSILAWLLRPARSAGL